MKIRESETFSFSLLQLEGGKIEQTPVLSKQLIFSSLSHSFISTISSFMKVNLFHPRISDRM
jgi:hypothetical protein